MKKQPIYQIDAFATTLFGGNPAAVCPLDSWLSDELMQSIAAENNLSETAFILPEGDDYHIRWFTPNTEVALCGHATLASAFVIFEYLDYREERIVFHSKSGELQVKRKGNLLQMDFPALPYSPVTPTPSLLKALNVQAKEVYESTFDLLVILDSEREVQEVKPDLQAIGELQERGVIFSAAASSADVYSRCFYPGCDVPEDPVTGSAHCVIAPYWAKRFGRNSIHALQGLRRQGELWCDVVGDRVLLSGSCQLYLQGHIFLP